MFNNKEILKKNTLILNHIQDLKSKKYGNVVNECLIEAEAIGQLTLIDISSIIGDRQEEEWGEFDHVYVNQTTDGGMTGDEFAGWIYIPITKKLYLRSYYSM